MQAILIKNALGFPSQEPPLQSVYSKSVWQTIPQYSGQELFFFHLLLLICWCDKVPAEGKG